MVSNETFVLSRVLDRHPQRGLVGVLDVDGDIAPAHHQVVGPADRAGGAGEALGQHA